MRNIGAEREELEPVPDNDTQISYLSFSDPRTRGRHAQDVEYANQAGQPEEVGVRLDKHTLDLVEFRRRGPALLLRCLREALRQSRKYGELPV